MMQRICHGRRRQQRGGVILGPTNHEGAYYTTMQRRQCAVFAYRTTNPIGCGGTATRHPAPSDRRVVNAAASSARTTTR